MKQFANSLKSLPLCIFGLQWEGNGTMRTRQHLTGSSMTEYGIIFALLVVGGIASYMALGGNISALYNDKEYKDQGGGAKLSRMEFDATAKGAARTEYGANVREPYSEAYYEVVFDENGMPHFVPSKSHSSSSVATTDHGNGFYADGIALARKLDQMADKYAKAGMTDLALELRKKATDMYYLAGAEGELDAISGLQVDPVKGLQYSKDNALRDVLKYKDSLKDFINDTALMSQLEPKDRLYASAYAADAYNIGQKYANALGEFINKNGYVNKNFATSSDGNAGTGKGGSVIKQAQQDNLSTAYDQLVPANGMSYENYYTPSEVRQRANAVLKEKSGTSNVKITITDAKMMDRLSIAQN